MNEARNGARHGVDHRGDYFENCSCDTICPCAWSAFTAKATHDRCYAMLAFQRRPRKTSRR